MNVWLLPRVDKTGFYTAIDSQNLSKYTIALNCFKEKSRGFVPEIGLDDEILSI